MSTLNKPNEEPLFAELLTKALDQELSEQEQQLFQTLLAKHPEWRQEWLKQKKLKEVMQTMKFKNPPSEIWDTYWVKVYNRIERGLAWILFSIGAIIVLIYSFYHLVDRILTDPELNPLLKTAILMLIAGLAILTVSVIREKLFVRKKDPYKEVQR